MSVAHVNGQERYDARVEPHTHFICRRCARVIDLLELEDAISGMYGEIEHRFGCLPESHTLTVSGLCLTAAPRLNEFAFTRIAAVKRYMY